MEKTTNANSYILENGNFYGKGSNKFKQLCFSERPDGIEEYEFIASNVSTFDAYGERVGYVKGSFIYFRGDHSNDTFGDEGRLDKEENKLVANLGIAIGSIHNGGTITKIEMSEDYTNLTFEDDKVFGSGTKYGFNRFKSLEGVENASE